MTTWQNLTQEDPGEPFGDDKSLNRRPYPAWWPAPAPYRNYNILEAVHGFPFLSWWSLERNGFPKCPKINIETCIPPTDTLLRTMPRLNELGDMWAKASQPIQGQSWIDRIGRPMAEFWDSLPGSEHYQLWEAYLAQNCASQLQFFGIPLKSVDTWKELYHPISATEGSLWFQEPLNYSPPKWTLMVVFTLMITIVHQVKKYPTTPFIIWDGYGTQDPHRNTNHYLHLEWVEDKSTFAFPILAWIKTKDEAQINLLAKRFRKGNSNVSFFSTHINLSDAELAPWTKEMSALLCFIRAYENGVFNKLTEQQTYYILQRSFPILYVEMLTRLIKKPPWAKSFRSIDDPSHIYTSPFANLRSTSDWMMWSLMVMWLDIKNNTRGLAAKVKAIPLNEDHYRYIFSDEPKQFEKDVKDDKEIDDAIEREKNRNESFWDPIEGRHIELPYHIYDPVFKDFSTKFQNAWRKTAEYDFLGLSGLTWPPKFPQLPFADPNSLEAKMYEFIAVNPPPKLKVPPIDPLMFQRFTARWENVYTHQYVYYMEWVYLNVNAASNPHYSPPGVQLKDPKGEYITIQSAGAPVPVVNSYPDLILKKDESGPFSISKAVSFLIIPIDQAAKFIWGDDWTQFLDQLGQKLWGRIKDGLKQLANYIEEKIRENLPDIGKILLVVGGVVLSGLLGVTYLEKKVEKFA